MKTKIIDRQTNKIYYEESLKSAEYLYKNKLGNLILMFATKRYISFLVGRILDAKISKILIPSFIKQNNIDMTIYEKTTYMSFNEFFSRKILVNQRPISNKKNLLISPADAKLLVYNISNTDRFTIKNKDYTLKTLFRDESLASEYKNGLCLVFRLTVDDYHRYCYIDQGSLLSTKKIGGKFHTVAPISFQKYRVFEENAREYMVLDTTNFGKIIQMEVGAMMVGKIVNHSLEVFERGEEKGYFLFGGSTILLFFKENVIKVDDDILKNSLKNIETRVHLGEIIGKKLL